MTTPKNAILATFLSHVIFYTDTKVAKKVLIVPFFQSSIKSLHTCFFFKKNGSRRSRPIFRFFMFSREDF